MPRYIVHLLVGICCAIGAGFTGADVFADSANSIEKVLFPIFVVTWVVNFTLQVRYANKRREEP